MRRILIFSIALTLLFSCSKKSDQTGVKNSTTVSINGITYPTVTIGNQVWTSINYRGSGGRAVGAAFDESIYGKYYDVSELGNIQLPAGWRVPTRADFTTLMSNFPKTVIVQGGNAIGDNSVSLALRSNSGWTYLNGNNSSGFNAVAAGDYNNFTMAAYSQGSGASFLSSTADTDTHNGNYNLYLYDHVGSPGIFCGVAAYPPGIKSTLRFVRDK
ncbi:hypothetical protein BH09BAC6_BH09BAC6_22110 [soil metagenome]|jgi:uncharacterized protein (TIGR02145 family)